MRAKVERIDQHHFRFSIRGMTGDIDVAIEGKPMGPSPKELLLAALCGCTGTDVIDLLKKFAVEYSRLELEARADLTDTHPKVFKRIDLRYSLTSATEKKESLLEAVKRSTHQYSGTAAMLSKACPIEYKIFLNEELIGNGVAEFAAPSPST
ncbi:OsmC family protein [Bdellovibrio sp. 22V]|uniref:OsmC family protein n=1 Tax=Bdellovibrio TaxID=958 RepID=UPI0025438A83|nr:OsmC family protein [Bdellovibrio sp. 22V]WII71189.1 OsmC family protein [Bdellovibrio sp. 22V]